VGALACGRFSRFGFLLERTWKGRFGRRLLFDDIDGYAIDKYGAVQDAYAHQQAQGEEEVKRGGR
jgi:hypothetical protein